MDVEVLARTLVSDSAADRFSGVVLLQRDGETLLEVAHGQEHRSSATPVTVRTRFGVASLSKTFTAVAIARLVERGVVRFDSPLIELLPLSILPVQFSPHVTLHHLLCHRSGIADYFDEERLGAAAYELIWETVPCYRIRRPSDFLPLFVHRPAIAEPGTPFAYCNAGYILLGLVLESLLGLSFGEVIQREVFNPAGMIDSGYLATDEPHPNLATGYIPSDADGQRWRSNVFAIPPVGAPDGGAMCTARDVDRYLDALAGGRLLGAEVLATLLSPHAPRGDTAAAYGYGVWLVQSGPSWRMLLQGEDPGFSARGTIYPDSAIRATVLCNISESSGRVLRQITSLLSADGQ
jgi:CubicO group peptidase (beta-lactamase class C family)